jgi:2-C-methyl-D-erythritol 2,4-cyclodiphosphate synthase
MVANVAVDLGIAPDSVNIKGKTNEKLGYLGRQEAIEAQAVVLKRRVLWPLSRAFRWPRK